jgi:hypothetical protein
MVRILSYIKSQNVGIGDWGLGIWDLGFGFGIREKGKKGKREKGIWVWD